MIDYRLDNKWTVYVHIAPNGKCYVGITSREPEVRWGKDGYGYKDQMFYKAIEKYGWDNIQHEIIASNLTQDEAEQMEITLIETLQSNKSKYGYNLSAGGNASGIIYRTIYQYTLDKKFIKRFYSIKDAAKESGENENLIYDALNRTFSYRLKYLWSSIKNDSFTEYKYIPIYKYTKNGVLIEKYDSLFIAGIKNNESMFNIRRCCNGERNTFKGYVWKYPEGINDNETECKKRPTNSKLKSIRCYQYDLNGELIKAWNSIYEASLSLGLRSDRITDCCDKKNEYYKDCIWRYDNEYVDPVIIGNLHFKVVAVSLGGGEPINFANIKEASQYLFPNDCKTSNSASSAIKRSCEYHKVAYGYEWRYVPDSSNDEDEAMEQYIKSKKRGGFIGKFEC